METNKKFSSPKSFSIGKNQRKVTFKDTSDIVEWAKNEKEFWETNLGAVLAN